MAASRTTGLTTTSYALLGLLSVRSWTTYELAKQVQRSLNWFWPRAERKLYDEPKRLADRGLVATSREYTGQRPRTVYTISAAGREALRAWLDEPSAPRATEFEAMVKVFFSDAGTLSQLRGVLAGIEQESLSRLRELVAMPRAALAGDALFPQRLHLNALSLRLQYEQERAVLEWARWAQRQVAAWDAADNPGSWDTRNHLTALIADADALLDDPRIET